MKNIISNFNKSLTTLLFMVCSLFLFSACSDDDGMGGGDFIRAKLDGVTFSAETSEGILTAGSPVSIWGLIGTKEVNSTNVEVLSISFLLNEISSLTEDTYQFNELDDCAGADVCGSFGYVTGSTSTPTTYSTLLGNSTIEVTSVNLKSGGRISGTFSGTLVEEYTEDEIVVTDGEFSVLIQ